MAVIGLINLSGILVKRLLPHHLHRIAFFLLLFLPFDDRCGGAGNGTMYDNRLNELDYICQVAAVQLQLTAAITEKWTS